MDEIEEQALSFWSLVTGVWNEGVFGIDLGRILIALLIFAGFYILRDLLARVVMAVAHRQAARTRFKGYQTIVDSSLPSLQLLVITLGLFVMGEYLALEGLPATVLLKAQQSLVALAIFLILYHAVKPLSSLFKRLEAILTPEMVGWLITGARGAIVLIGFATVLQIWGIQVAPLIAGLGLFGVAVALGAQDLFANLLAGLSILVEKRFGAGDWVQVEGVVEGTVEHVGFRSTRIRRFDKAPVYVPNTEFSSKPVTNFSAMTHRRIYWKIGVEYRTTKAQLAQIRNGIEAFLLNSDAFCGPPEVPMFVRIDAFNDSSIDIMVYCFTRTTVWGEWLQAKEQLAYAIKDIVEAAGTGFAFPSTSIYLESLPAGTPDVFAPPAPGTGQ